MIDCNDCVWKETCNAHQGGVIGCPDGKLIEPAPSSAPNASAPDAEPAVITPKEV